jgi:glycosyltransferase involved in cell wall biosynthesis
MAWLTIVVPTHNQVGFLEACLRSISEQSYGDWDCVVIDDGSSDGSPELIHRFVRADRRFQYLRQENQGVSAARNAGLRMARGEWTSFLDSDDLYFPGAVGRFKACADALAHLPAAPLIISGQVVTSFVEPAPPRSWMTARVEDLLFRAMHVTMRGRSPLLQNTIFHRSVFEATGGGFLTNLPTSEDREFLIRACAVSDVALMESLVAYYRTNHGAGKSDRYLASGRKTQAHRSIFSSLSGSPAVHRRLLLRGGGETFERLRQAYLLMLDAADDLRAGDPSRCAQSLQQMDEACVNDDERKALVLRFAFFFRFPSSLPEVAVRRSLRALESVCPLLDTRTGVRLAVERQIRHEAEKLATSGGRHVIVSPWEKGLQEDPGADTDIRPRVRVDLSNGEAVTPGALRRFRVPALQRFGLAGGRSLVYSAPGGPLIVENDVAEVLSACRTFRTLDQHVQLAAARGLLALDRRPALKNALEALYARGALVSVEDVLRPAAAANQPDAAPISVLAVRRAGDGGAAETAVRSYLSNAAVFERRFQVLVLDDRQGPGPLSGAWPVSGALAPDPPGVVRQLAPEARRQYCRLVAGAAAVREEIVHLALLPSEQTSATSASAMNVMLLETIGRSVMVVDDHSRCIPARVPTQHEVLLLTAQKPPARTVAYRDESSLHGDLDREVVDLLACHERYLGRPYHACAAGHSAVDVDLSAAHFLTTNGSRQPHVLATLSSAYGKVFGQDPKLPLFARDDMDPALIADPAAYRTLFGGACGYQGVAHTTIARSTLFHLAATAIWNQRWTLLPPFLPFLKDPERAFGWLVATTEVQARFAYLPVAVALTSDRPPTEGDPEVWETAGRLDFQSLFGACLSIFRKPLGVDQPEDLLMELGRHVTSLASLSMEDLLSQIEVTISRWTIRELAVLERALDVHEGRPEHWAADVRRYQRTLENRLGGAQPSPDDVNHSEETAQRARRQLRLCGELLQSWPEIVRAAIELKDAAHPGPFALRA